MKVPWKVLFSNDTTNILSCTSPYHERGEPFGPEMLQASVDETADTGVEVHLLQPGLGVAPWWKSSQYPFERHADFIRKTYGAEPDGFGRYMLEGGDIVQVFIDRCRERDLVPFLSLRLNDSHGKQFVDAAGDVPSLVWTCINRFYKAHPEDSIAPDPNDWHNRVLNWAEPEVRDWMFGFIRELCEQYDIDGFELDFMRHCNFFRAEETSSAERKDIMTDFVRRVRELLDATSASGRRRRLCARVPAYLAAHDPLGLDLPRLVEAGLEMVNLSYYYFTEQQGDFAQIRRLVPNVSVYAEMAHTTRVGPRVGDPAVGDNFSFRRTTPTQYYTTAHLAYSRGLDGVSAFNFVYYREHGTEGRGPFCEPPFEVFEHLDDPEWLARQQHHYFVGETWDQPPLPERQLPRTLQPGDAATFRLNLCPTERGWRADGKLRIQADQPLTRARFTARVNGESVQEIDDRSEPFEDCYPPLLGAAEHHRAWTVPPIALRNGVNEVEIALTTGDPATLVFVDLAMVEHLR
jgi:hypothetical protein